MWNGRIGLPVAPASNTAPRCATRAGPRGPSTVNPDGLPRRKVAPQLNQRARAAARRRAPRGVVAEPLTIRAIHSPSKFWLMMTTMPRLRKKSVAGQDAAVPEGEDRLLAGGDDRVVVLEALDAPAVGRTERARSSGSATVAMAAALSRPSATCRRRAAHMPSYCGPAAAFGRHPVDDLVRVHDVARLAVHAVGGVDLQLLLPGAVVHHLVDVGGTEARCTGCRTPRGSASRRPSASCTIRCDGWSSGCRVPE